MNIMKQYIISNKKGLILVLIGFVILVMMITINTKSNTKEVLIGENTYEANINVARPVSKRELTEGQVLNIYLEEKKDIITFLANTFQIDSNILANMLKIKAKELDLLNQTNFEAFLVNYLFDLEDMDKTLFSKTHNPCKDSKEYMVALIKYFTQIYSEVDFTIAAGIAQIESNYAADGMLYRNNIFGGMYSGGLIKYKNIEYGILKYIKLLNDGYFTKGLKSVADIGIVYNPMFNENGIKIAKPTWVANVTKAMEEFASMPSVDITKLNNLKNNA